MFGWMVRGQVHDDEFWLALHEVHERVAVGGDFQFHAELLAVSASFI